MYEWPLTLGREHPKRRFEASQVLVVDPSIKIGKIASGLTRKQEESEEVPTPEWWDVAVEAEDSTRCSATAVLEVEKEKQSGSFRHDEGSKAFEVISGVGCIFSIGAFCNFLGGKPRKLCDQFFVVGCQVSSPQQQFLYHAGSQF